MTAKQSLSFSQRENTDLVGVAKSVSNNIQNTKDNNRDDSILSNRLSQRLAGPFNRIRWSGMTRASQEATKTTSPRDWRRIPKSSKPADIKIGEPTLCSASSSMDGELDEGLSPYSFQTRPITPPKSHSQDRRRLSELQGAELRELTSSSVSNETNSSTPPSLVFNSPLSIGASTTIDESLCGTTALAELPSKFDEFRAKAYANEGRPVSVANVPSQGYSQRAENNDTVIRGSHTSPIRDPKLSSINEGAEQKVFLASPRSSSRSPSNSGASSHSTVATNASQEFDFGIGPPKSSQPPQNNRVISTWRPEQLVSRASRSPELYPEALMPARDPAASQVSLGVSIPQPPKKASRITASTRNSSVEDLAHLLSTLDLSLAVRDGCQSEARALPNERSATDDVDNSAVYKEAISRLNSVRLLEIRQLNERIVQLESRRQRLPKDTEPPLMLFEKIQGLPRLLPIRPSTH